ncbi:MAG: shikimate dehydrogenase [Paludibacteraceae bacterium]|nr:shikimate dehydrogenase [Paludibacteraceae bacterium]
MPRPLINRLFSIIGNPLAQSYSKTYWNEKFAERKMTDCLYEARELKTIQDFIPYLDSKPNLHGLSVTIPFKEVIIPLLDEVDPVAQEIGAVNCIKIERSDGKRILKGYNTDWVGFTESLKPLLKPCHKKALLLGTGGASKAVIYSLSKLGIEITQVSRSKPGTIRYEDIDEKVMSEHLVVINATPVGSFPAVNKCPDVPYQYFTPEHIAFDLIYNPIRTLFLQQAELKGATIKNGWEMFTGQAAEAWRILFSL